MALKSQKELCIIYLSPYLHLLTILVIVKIVSICDSHSFTNMVLRYIYIYYIYIYYRVSTFIIKIQKR